jgi:hypothetical protein
LGHAADPPLTLILECAGTADADAVGPLGGARLVRKFMIEPNSLMGERARRLFWRAKELIRRQGIATQDGVQVKAGLITIHVTKWPPQSEESRSQFAAADRKWFPYRLDIWQRQHVMLSVNYNDTDEIEIAAFKRGVWEYRLPSLRVVTIEENASMEELNQPRRRGA